MIVARPLPLLMRLGVFFLVRWVGRSTERHSGTMMSMTTISINHTYTMVSYMMTVDDRHFVVKEGCDANDGDSEVREIIETDEKGTQIMVVQTHTDEWLRLERLFQSNRPE